MTDRDSRDRLAFALRQFASGLVTNDEFDDKAFAAFSHRRDDPALAELATYGWLHYDDMRTYRLRGRYALSPEERKSIARAVLFLKTDQEYVHGNSLESSTVLGGPWLRGCLIVLGVAVAIGAFTYFALSTRAARGSIPTRSSPSRKSTGAIRLTRPTRSASRAVAA